MITALSLADRAAWFCLGIIAAFSANLVVNVAIFLWLMKKHDKP